MQWYLLSSYVIETKISHVSGGTYYVCSTIQWYLTTVIEEVLLPYFSMYYLYHKKKNPSCLYSAAKFAMPEVFGLSHIYIIRN